MKCGAMREAEGEDLNNVIPLEAFDMNPVERYEPCFGPGEVLAMLTKGECLNCVSGLAHPSHRSCY
jgi:hypothetical protein